MSDGDLTARDVIARAMAMAFEGDQKQTNWYHRDADAVLAALTAAGWRLERDDQWEWPELWPSRNNTGSR